MAEAMSDERLAADLDGAELLAVARAHHAAYMQSHSHAGAFACCSAHTSADDVPELVAEIERLRALEQSYIVALDQANIGDMQRLTQRAETAERELTELGRVEYEIGIQQPGEDDAQQYCGFSEADVRARAADQGATYVERVCRRGKWKAADDGS